MKELTTEEKAKLYDEAKARMSKAYNSNRCTLGFMNEIFPELIESEDEEVRKEIMQLIQGMLDVDPRKKRWLAWLEKQNPIMAKSPQLGEQKPSWSKEDKEMLREALVLIETVEDKNKVKDCFLGVKTWLKSLKGRIGG